MTAARYPTAEAIGAAMVSACRVTGEDPIKAFASKGTARAQTCVLAALTLAYPGLTWAERARLAGVQVSCPRHHVKWARETKWWPQVGAAATEAARAAFRLHVVTGVAEERREPEPRATPCSMGDAEAAIIRRMAGEHRPQAIADRIDKTEQQVIGFARRAGISLKAKPGSAYELEIAEARSAGVQRAWTDPEKRDAMVEASRRARPAKAAPAPSQPKPAKPPKPPRPVARPQAPPPRAPKPRPEPQAEPAAPLPPSHLHQEVKRAEPRTVSRGAICGGTSLTPVVLTSAAPAAQDPVMAQFKPSPPPGICGRMAVADLPDAAPMVLPSARRGSRTAGKPAPIDPEKISDVARDLSRQELCAEAIYVRQLRTLRTPWSHIHRQVGARGTVDDLRRKYDPNWKEPAHG